MRNATGVLRKRSLFLVPSSLSVTTIVMLAISGMIGLDHVFFKGKQVGFLFAPNWTISPLLIFPLVGALTLLFVSRVDRTIRDLVERKMLFDVDSRQFLSGPGAVTRNWNDLLKVALWAWLVLTVLGVFISVKEWRDASYVPLHKYENAQAMEDDLYKQQEEGKKGPKEEKDGKVEIDWSVANLIKPVGRVANWLFSLAAFLLLQGTMLALVALYLVVGVAFGALVIGLSGQGRIILLPELSSQDDRKGFEVFTGLGSELILTSLCLFSAFYLTILQNIYLRDERATSIYQMLVEPIRLGMADGEWGMLLSPDFSTNFSSGFALLGGILVLFLVLLVIPGILLSYAASRSRDCALRLARAPEGEALLGMTRAEAEAKLEPMKVWPYRYYSMNMLLATVLLLAATLFWPYLAAYLYGVALASILAMVIKKIKKQFKGPEESKEPSKEEREAA